ncbi:MAG: hypothetical protein LH468_07840 [Nocardioides sp.]|nr:hypothetical protein [Nocardioides sp.]
MARLRLVGMPLARIRVVSDLPPRAAVAELTSYWPQVEADTASAGALVRDLVAGLRGKEHDLTVTDQIRPGAALGGIGAWETQQDAARIAAGVYAVADGFGRAQGLPQAALDELDGLDLDGDVVAGLDAALARAAAMVAARYADEPGAGTTLTALVLREGRAVLVDEGRLTPEEARSDNRRVQLNRAIAVERRTCRTSRCTHPARRPLRADHGRRAR